VKLEKLGVVRLAWATLRQRITPEKCIHAKRSTPNAKPLHASPVAREQDEQLK
jgi:hypothetical protein